MRARAASAGLGNVFDLDEALDWLAGLRAPELRNAAAAERVEAYQIPGDAPIFDSLKADYPQFPAWWQNKVVDERRPVIVLGELTNPEGLAVLKEEPGAFALAAHVLKLCTFKIAEGQGRSRRGEFYCGL